MAAQNLHRHTFWPVSQKQPTDSMPHWASCFISKYELLYQLGSCNLGDFKDK